MPKLGKLPARKGAVTFKLEKYGAKLPSPPPRGGHISIVPDWQGMMGNDKLGDCVCAEAGHGTIYMNALGGRKVQIDTAEVVKMYSVVAGYNPSDPDSDQGTDMQAAASYRRKTGILDAHNKRHHILAYLAIDKGDVDTLKKALYYFNMAGVGFNFPDYAMDQFNDDKPWSVQKGGKLQGGHDVLAIGYDTKYIYCVSWGKLVKMEYAFFKKYCDEALVYLSAEMFTSGKSPEGFDLATLTADLTALQ